MIDLHLLAAALIAAVNASSVAAHDAGLSLSRTFSSPRADALAVGASDSVNEIDNLSVATPGGYFSALAQRTADIINVRDLAAGTCQGNAVADTAALNAAIAKASSAPGSTIYMPACTWVLRVPAGTTGFRIPSRTTLDGDGAGKTVITWNDDLGNNLFGSTGTAGARAKDIAFSDFTVRGTWDARGNADAYPFLPVYVNGLTFDRVASDYSRTMGIVARASTSVQARGTTVRYAGRDGINFSQCAAVSVIDNVLEHIDDDAIAIHSDNLDPWKVRRNLVITGNRIFNAQGIKVLGARQATISGNTLDVVKSQGINITTQAANNGSSLEGGAAALAITITDNVITNLLKRNNIDNLNQGAPGIIVSGSSARAGSYAAIPGEPNTATASIIDPYKEVLANSPNSSVPTPGGYGILISGNVIARTLPASNGSDPRFAKFSDFGAGSIFTRTGFLDPSLSEDDFRDNGVVILGGVLRDVLITNNIIRGMVSGLSVGSGTRFDNIVFRGNQVVDTLSFGIVVNTTAKLRLYVDDNIFDLDPFHKHPARGPNGTWTSGSSPTGIQGQAGSGVYVRRNVFRNMARDFSGDVTNPAAGWYFEDNIAEADVSGFGGFSTANKGIGTVRRDSDAVRYARVDSDPASSTYGTILAMPSHNSLGTPGVNGRPSVALGALVDGSGVRTSLGSTYSVPSNTSLVRFTQATTLASSTVTLPAGAQDGQLIQFANYAGAVTALSFSPAVNGWSNSSTLGAFTGLKIRWDATAAAWYREQ